MNPKLGRVLGFGITVLLLPFALSALLFEGLAHAAMFVAWQARFGSHGKRGLAVYSDGPKWKAHFESEVLPLLGQEAVVVNTTTTPSWAASSSLARRVHRRWGTNKHHTPVVILFPRRFGKVKVFRFHEAYLRFTHNGDATALRDVTASLRSMRDDA